MKHLLNDLSNEEKNRIREQYEGGISVDTSKFKKLVETKLGDAKPFLNENKSLKEQNVRDIQDLLVNKLGFNLGTTGRDRNGIDNDLGPLTLKAIYSALTNTLSSNNTQQQNNQQNQGYINGGVLTPEYEKELISNGMTQETLDNFKKIPNYYKGSINKIEFDKGEQWSWMGENNTLDFKDDIYYLDDGRKLKPTIYDQQNDKFTWVDDGKWM